LQDIDVGSLNYTLHPVYIHQLIQFDDKQQTY
jgi:hypothetical protein